MLISLRVKTLDSQDHEFSVEDAVTVREFKERIQEKTGIEADLQRLIYCGRVMSDDCPLSEYDINGKVIHLVQRPPPGSAPRAVSSSSESANNGNRRENDNGRTALLRSLDGMVLGAMAIPMNTNSGTTQSITHSMNPSSTLCMNRITVARHMLNCANNIAAYLENPERGLNNTEMDILAQQTMESTVFEVGISAVSDADVPQQHVQGLVQAFQGVVSAAFRQNGLSNIQVDAETGTAQATIPLVFGATGPQTGEINANNSTPLVTFIPNTSNASVVINGSANEPTSDASAPTVISASVPIHVQTTAPNDNNAEANASSENASGERSNNQQITRTQTLAEVVQQMRTVQARLEPFINQYYEILQNEPTFSNTTERENAQRVFDRVSEALHYFSHAQHAISDLMLDLSLDTPRHLCCRPILVEQSAFVSSGFAVPNMLIPLARRTAGNGNNSDTSATNNNNNNTNNNNNDSNNNNNNNSNNNVNSNENSAESANTSTDGATATNTSTPNRMPGNINPAAAQRAANVSPRLQVARLIQAVVNSVPAHADVHVEINQNPRSFEPHIEIHNVQQPPASTSATTSSNGSSPEQESSQPRVTTATHPTTSTQTRSTARPQVHATGLPTGQIRNLRPVPIPTMQLSAFDRYLPCNSHHIREPESNQQQQQQQQRPQQFHVQRNPQVHIQRPTPTTTRLSNVFNNRRNNNVAPPTSAATSTATNNMQTNDVPTQTQLNEAELDTPVQLFGCNQVQLQVRDLINVSPTPSTLNRIRNDLRQYIVTTFSLGTPLTDENISSAVNQVIIQMNQFLLLLPDLNIPDYDARASIENLIRKTLPFVINLIKEDESSEFGVRLLREIKVFSKRLIVILLHCIGRPSAQDYLKIIIEAIFSSIVSSRCNEQRAKSALQWLRKHMHSEILRRFHDIGTDTEDVIEFLVIRRPAPVTVSQGQAEAPMETDADTADNNETLLSDANEEREEDIEPLPSITIGSENWHHNFPTPWLPIITRDISRQRRQSPQRPFSDAYISGMSSKRRKLINGSKPSVVEPNNLIAQGVRQVLQSSRLNNRSGVGGSGSSSSSSAGSVVNTAAAIEEAIASNPHIHEPYGSYEQAILNHVQNRISTDPDYNPERFPNCSKWVKKNK